MERMKCIRDAVCDGEYEVRVPMYWDLYQRGDMEMELRPQALADGDGSDGIQVSCGECGHELPRVFSAQVGRAVHAKEQQIMGAGL